VLLMEFHCNLYFFNNFFWSVTFYNLERELDALREIKRFRLVDLT
jgi:hypothetical protein